jgi:hypothetical protein
MRLLVTIISLLFGDVIEIVLHTLRIKANCKAPIQTLCKLFHIIVDIEDYFSVGHSFFFL